MAHHPVAVVTTPRTVVVAVTVKGRSRGDVPTGPRRFWNPWPSVNRISWRVPVVVGQATVTLSPSIGLPFTSLAVTNTACCG